MEKKHSARVSVRFQVFMAIAVCFLLVIIAIIIFGVTLKITPRQRIKLYKYYSDDSVYITVSGTITKCNFHNDGSAGWTVRFDEACIEALGEEGIARFGGRNSSGAVVSGGKLVGKSQAVLVEKDFYNLFSVLDDGTVEDEFQHTVEIITVPKTWWDGWSNPIVQVKVDGEIYLDFATGKANLLDWLILYA